LPFGAIFDLKFGTEPKIPIDIIVRYRNFPNEKLLEMEEGLSSVRNQYF